MYALDESCTVFVATTPLAASVVPEPSMKLPPSMTTSESFIAESVAASVAVTVTSPTAESVAFVTHAPAPPCTSFSVIEAPTETALEPEILLPCGMTCVISSDFQKPASV